MPMMGAGLMMGPGWLFMVLVVVGVVLLVVLLVRVVTSGTWWRRQAGDADAPRRSEARRRLDSRYADGQLSTEEYLERLRIMGETR